MIRNRWLWPFFLLGLQVVIDQLTGTPASFFDPLLAAVVLYAYFHSYDVRDNIVFAALCGLVKDLMGLDVFGLYAVTFPLVSFGVMTGTRFLNRQQDIFVFPLTALAVFVHRFAVGMGRLFFFDAGPRGSIMAFLLRIGLTAAGTAVFAYALYRLSRLCDLGLTESSSS
jgi:cell shape-determining protein MreD